MTTTGKNKTRISELAAIVEEKWRHFSCLGMLNTYGKTTEELVRMNQEYAAAAADALAAQGNLRTLVTSSSFEDGVDGVVRGTKSSPVHEPARMARQDGKEHLYVFHNGLWYHFPPKDWKHSET